MTQHIPNFITCCNLISGCIATSFAFAGDMRIAMLWIIIGAVFDFFDGMVARLLNVSSPIGKELDSLADVVTFGVAPSAMLFYQFTVMDYPSFLECLRKIIPYGAFLMAAFSALRLAKFNIDERQTSSFIGLPTPANALFWSALIVGSGNRLYASPHIFWLLVVLLLLSCWIMIAEVPMFALKIKHWTIKGNEVRLFFLLTSLLLLLFFRVFGFSIIIVWYIILSVFLNHREMNANK